MFRSARWRYLVAMGLAPSLAECSPSKATGEESATPATHAAEPKAARAGRADKPLSTGPRPPPVPQRPQVVIDCENVDETYDVTCDKFDAAPSRPRAPPPYERCAETLRRGVFMSEPPNGAARFNAEVTRVTCADLGCGYGYCKTISVASASSAPPIVKCGSNGESPACFPAPPRGTSQPGPDPFPDCPAAVQLYDGPQRLDPKSTTERRRTPASAHACCYMQCQVIPGGRPLVADGHMVTAGFERRSDWTASASLVGAASLAATPAAVRAVAAAHWRREAAFEHASVASFARFALQLLAAGAPPELIAGAHEAALDEVEHARLAYAIARALDGTSIGPGPLPLAGVKLAPTSLAMLAVETLRDGCVGETLAALVAEASARSAAPEVARVLERIAADETRHAELAWRTLTWAVRTGGPDVVAALSRERAHLAYPDPAPALPAADPSLERWGVPGPEARNVRASALAEVVLPCLDALLEASRPSPGSPTGSSRIGPRCFRC